MCGSLGNSNYTGIIHVLAPSLTPRGGILVRMVSCGMVGMAGDWYMYMSNVDLHANLCGSAHCECVVNGSVAMAAI